MEELKTQLKQQIIDALNLEDITPADIDNEAPLFGDGLGLDSIDALEIILILESNYGIHIANAGEARPLFKSINTLADFVAANKK
ncbi:MAG: phosphopantetheine-binding protein [Bacteroidales bacterium]|nr:phosphopantetheine-binding protein [Bacteroidales bacterium]